MSRPTAVSDDARDDALGIVVPVVAGRDVVGLIDVESDRANAFGDADEELLERCAAVIVPLWRPNPVAYEVAGWRGLDRTEP